MGPTSKGKGGEGEGREGKGRERREGRGGREGEGGLEGPFCEILNTPLNGNISNKLVKQTAKCNVCRDCIRLVG